MRRFAYLPLGVLGLALSTRCGGEEFRMGDASVGEAGGSSGNNGGASSSSGGVAGSGSGGTGSSGGRGGNGSGGGNGSSGGSHGSSGGGSGSSSNSGSASGGSGGNSGNSGSTGGNSGGGSSSGSASSSGSGGSGGGYDAGQPCLSNGCDAGTTCCGLSCCAPGQLCCAITGPVPPADPYYCMTPTASQPTCPPGCSPKCVSDRSLKRDIAPVEVQRVLEAVSELPISTWSYRTDDPSVRHLGPMAQDFFAAFGLGDSDRSYDPIDAHGVAFAAIKALNEQLQRQNERIERLELENRALREQASRPVCR
jgi:Chaperone of endosialidase